MALILLKYFQMAVTVRKFQFKVLLSFCIEMSYAFEYDRYKSIAMKNELQVSGMSCGGCELLVKEALEEQVGVTQAEASYLKGVVDVDYDPELISMATIRAVIEQQGFRVQD
jgi:copper chaperone